MCLSQPWFGSGAPSLQWSIIVCIFPTMTPLLPLLARSCGLLFIFAVSACSFVEDPMAKAMSKMTPYRTEVVQGNFVSKEQAQALRPGMTRRQVKDILGTPLIVSLFHADRWDYAFTIKRQGTAAQQRKLSVFFKNDVFDRVEAEDLPSESEFAEKLTTTRRESIKVPPLKASEQDLDKLRKAEPAPTEPEAESDTNAKRKTYPPLETRKP
jgi:outer membrane protein assembly factor BamE